MKRNESGKAGEHKARRINKKSIMQEWEGQKR
jgi:hypothetical protein